MDLTTQLGGVYRPNNDALFAAKTRLQDAGIKVTHPISRDFVFVGKHAYTFDPNIWTSYEIALDYYKSIALCDFHFVCNKKADQIGYVGRDTARAMVYAMLKNKPVALLHSPQLADDVDQMDRNIIKTRSSQITVFDILNEPQSALWRFVAALTKQKPAYSLSPNESSGIRERTQAYFLQTTVT